jgi:N-acetylmuramoyl-L-alanine amidase
LITWQESQVKETVGDKKIMVFEFQLQPCVLCNLSYLTNSSEPRLLQTAKNEEALTPDSCHIPSLDNCVQKIW